ncbi:hypothetical protein BV898_17554 [Hypsibius exemplaris]|uniref:Uncharacterized protein n=1 Tax=Hypsibius exemplaris TaxID=2072580 RepID=A0A9X6RMX2_HYPEX|nr:hypothetical protein BV898_17554 [Hypsibius exemplaris]
MSRTSPEEVLAPRQEYLRPSQIVGRESWSLPVHLRRSVRVAAPVFGQPFFGEWRKFEGPSCREDAEQYMAEPPVHRTKKPQAVRTATAVAGNALEQLSDHFDRINLGPSEDRWRAGQRANVYIKAHISGDGREVDICYDPTTVKRHQINKKRKSHIGAILVGAHIALRGSADPRNVVIYSGKQSVLQKMIPSLKNMAEPPKQSPYAAHLRLLWPYRHVHWIFLKAAEVKQLPF